MKTLVIYYSYTGHTKTEAEGLATKESADITEIKDIKRPCKFKAYFPGCFAALRGKSWPILPIDTDLSAYDRFMLLSPVWAGNPTPAVNSVFSQLPSGKSVFVKMVSASGKSGCKERIGSVIKGKGCTLEGFEDIKARGNLGNK